MFVYARWSGWGILALPVLTLGIFGGMLGTTAIFYDLAASEGHGIDHAGVPLGGLAVGVIIGGVLTTLLGLALNRRRHRDGTWYATDRHEFFEKPVENVGLGAVVTGIVLLPLALVHFVPTLVVWIVFLGWAALVITAVARLVKRRRAREDARLRVTFEAHRRP
jgi:hypothetical protein